MTRTLLFGDDGSSSADLAWMWINAQVWGDWHVDVLHAEPATPGQDDSPAPWAPPHPRTLLNPVAAASVGHWRAAADPRIAIQRCADRDLIVVGPKGRSVLKTLHLGSTAEWLIHNPPAPLVIAKRGVPVRTAVVCTDGSNDALAAARSFASMPWLPEVDVTVLAVQQVGLDTEAAAAESASLLEGRAKSVLPLAVGPDETEVFYHVRDIILAQLQRLEADLVVQGTTGRSGWSAMRAGSIATSLAIHAPCSVFMTHDRSHAPQ